MVTWGSNTTVPYTPGTPSTSSLFGAPSTPGQSSFSLFAGSTPGPAPFPATPSTPGAGTSGFSFGGGTPGAASNVATPGSAGTSLFGGTSTPATPGLFGSPSTPSNANTSGLFGSNTPQTLYPPAGNASTGLFGSTAAAPPSGGLFGSSAPFTSPLGTQQTQPYSQQYQQPSLTALQAHLQAQHRQETARIESSLCQLYSAYSTIPTPAATTTTAYGTPTPPQVSSECQFQYVFYDPIDSPSQQQLHHQHQHHHPHDLSAGRPPHIDARTWAEAQAHNPNPSKLVPVLVIGAEALQSRVAHQQHQANQCADILSTLRNHLIDLNISINASVTAVSHTTQEQRILERRVLQIMKKVELLRCFNVPTQTGEMEWRHRLRGVEVEVRKVHGKLQDVMDLAERYKRVRDEGHGTHSARGTYGGSNGKSDGRAVVIRDNGSNNRSSHVRQNDNEDSMSIPLTHEDKMALYHVLDEQQKGLTALTNIIKKDARDVEIVKKELSSSASRKALVRREDLRGERTSFGQRGGLVGRDAR